jgi:hypothetical protein
MARTLALTSELSWPLEDGKQAAKVDLGLSFTYTSSLHIEKVYAAPVTDEVLELPMTSAKFLLLRSIGTGDVQVKLNGNANALTLKAGEGYLLLYNPDGDVTGVTVTVAAQPATLQGWAFA